MFVSANELRNSPLSDLERIKRDIEEEIQRRRSLERQHLINEFQKAWGELKNAHIRITYNEGYDADTAYLDDWDGFDFD